MMNKRRLICTSASLALSGLLLQAKNSPDSQRIDSLSTTQLQALEVMAPATMQTTLPLYSQPINFSYFSGVQTEQYGIQDLTGLTSRVPGLYIPDYGSRGTGAIYLRGLGARSSGQTIGYYIDGVPMLNKASFNQDLLGVQSIQVLRGPQGTLYGRNAMGGIVHISTLSALDNQTLSASVGLGSYHARRGSVSYRQKLGEHWGISIYGQGQQHNGYRYNVTRGSDQDSLSTASILAKLEYRPNSSFSSALSIGYDYTSQGSHPYQLLDSEGTLLPLANNEPVHFRRRTLTARVRTTTLGDWWKLETGTGAQVLRHQTSLDMDFSARPIFYAEQDAREQAYSQELVFKSRQPEDRYQWSYGVFGFYQRQRIGADVTLRPAALSIIQAGIDRQTATNPHAPKLTFDNSADVVNPDYFVKPDMGIALYHESTIKDFITPGLSLTAGLRLDYGHQQISYDGTLGLRLGVTPPVANAPTQWYYKPTHLEGKASQHNWQLLPKIALQYALKHGAIYASASKGYKSAGYNEQSFNDIIQKAQMQDLMALGRPNATGFDATGLGEQLAYRAETAWSYELGYKLHSSSLLEHLSASTYYSDVHNLQVTRFVASGQGRIITNEGRAYTLGAELTAILSPIGRSYTSRGDNLSLILNYGWSYARFHKGEAQGSNAGQYVPYIPRHSFSAMLSGGKQISSKLRLFAETELSGLGEIVWSSNARQDLYTLLSARLGINYHCLTLSLSGKNLTNKSYYAFYVSSLGSSAVQLGAPRTLGVDLSVKL